VRDLRAPIARAIGVTEADVRYWTPNPSSYTWTVRLWNHRRFTVSAYEVHLSLASEECLD
jgi:hypothetical protein